MKGFLNQKKRPIRILRNSITLIKFDLLIGRFIKYLKQRIIPAKGIMNNTFFHIKILITDVSDFNQAGLENSTFKKL